MTCSECGAEVDTREVGDGGGAEGVQMSSGWWVCSRECCDRAVMALYRVKERPRQKSVIEDLVVPIWVLIWGHHPNLICRWIRSRGFFITVGPRYAMIKRREPKGDTP